MRKTSDKKRTKRGLCILGRGPWFEAALSLETLDNLVERGFATCVRRGLDSDWILTASGATALLQIRRAA